VKRKANQPDRVRRGIERLLSAVDRAVEVFKEVAKAREDLTRIVRDGRRLRLTGTDDDSDQPAQETNP
jgi:hypothetical protein